MTYRELWQSLVPLYGGREAKSVARTVFDDLFGLSLTDICAGKDTELSANERRELEKTASRLLTGEPVQYVVGSAMFCGNRFVVRPGTLIPRPETAGLVGLAVRHCAASERQPAVLDIGTGSGCVAVSIAKAVPAARVSAWDISAEALAVARENARRLGVGVSFALQDARRPPRDTACWDVIVSNPPYVCERERKTMEARVLDYEPSLALFVSDDDPLVFYRHIARYARTALREGGLLAVEINPLYADEVAATMQEQGFCGIEVIADEFGKRRFVAARKFQVAQK